MAYFYKIFFFPLITTLPKHGASWSVKLFFAYGLEWTGHVKRFGKSDCSISEIRNLSDNNTMAVMVSNFLFMLIKIKISKWSLIIKCFLPVRGEYMLKRARFFFFFSSLSFSVQKLWVSCVFTSNQNITQSIIELGPAF